MTATAAPPRQRHLPPAELVSERFGDCAKLAAELDLARSTVWRWTQTDQGLIPARWHADILALAKRRGIPLTMKEMIYGGVG